MFLPEGIPTSNSYLQSVLSLPISIYNSYKSYISYQPFLLTFHIIPTYNSFHTFLFIQSPLIIPTVPMFSSHNTYLQFRPFLPTHHTIPTYNSNNSYLLFTQSLQFLRLIPTYNSYLHYRNFIQSITYHFYHYCILYCIIAIPTPYKIVVNFYNNLPAAWVANKARFTVNNCKTHL